MYLDQPGMDKLDIMNYVSVAEIERQGMLWFSSCHQYSSGSPIKLVILSKVDPRYIS